MYLVHSSALHGLSGLDLGLLEANPEQEKPRMNDTVKMCGRLSAIAVGVHRASSTFILTRRHIGCFSRTSHGLQRSWLTFPSREG